VGLSAVAAPPLYLASIPGPKSPNTDIEACTDGTSPIPQDIL